ncbi:FAD-dependent monooxygenase [Piscirickettsia litoralis]|uniref:Ubiquinone biosynthesis protein n=1 Tax=Piscirickettsia litoralis TaxID=1891921 RepID=A0ABX3A2R5_9GAMM|nr:FAD-dependent monooxygenase [Piscirickettsia litoralis]ODN42738.1 ubiquinone biosynthesis protein [Piscirickettsia litoralis]
MKQVDVAIVGGGVVGCSLALALVQFTNLDVALIEALPANDQEKLSALDQRSIALSLTSCRLLKHLGLWQNLQLHAQPIEHIEVSEQGAWSKTRLGAKKLGYAAFGYVIPLDLIQRALSAELRVYPDRIQHLAGTRLCEMNDSADSDQPLSTLTLQKDGLASESQLQARLVIGADGTGSTVRRLANFAVEQHDYQQQALVTNIQLKRTHQARSFERFTKSGSLGLLPLTKQRMALFWAAPCAEIKALLELSTADFIENVYQMVGYSLGACTAVGKRVVFPLKKTIAVNSWREGCILLGNAEHTLHPLSGQGLNLGLYDLACMLDVLQDSIDRQEFIGSANVLERYSQKKQKRNQHIIRDIDYLLAGFANPLAPVGKVRRAWLSSLELMGPLRQARVQKTLGCRLPSLLTAAGPKVLQKGGEELNEVV